MMQPIQVVLMSQINAQCVRQKSSPWRSVSTLTNQMIRNASSQLPIYANLVIKSLLFYIQYLYTVKKCRVLALNTPLNLTFSIANPIRFTEKSFEEAISTISPRFAKIFNKRWKLKVALLMKSLEWATEKRLNFSSKII